MTTDHWQPAGGKMGFMTPLLGTWITVLPDTANGPIICLRKYEEILGGRFIRLVADWTIGADKRPFQEVVHYGVNHDNIPAFWSFTSDGGQSYGEMANVTGMDDSAKGFIIERPSGFARIGFWPVETGMIWAAQAKRKNGWDTVVHHACEPV